MAKTHDGSDFKHRQRILPQYQTIALSKKRLKFVAILHLLIACLMVLKLLPTVLDHLNIFWQPLEELYIPMAQPWEWVWFSGLLFVLIVFKAIRTNNTLELKVFLLGITITCALPLLYCAYLNANDFWIYFTTRDARRTSEVWRGYPVALFWYIFIGVACQVHFFELFFASELVKSINSHHHKAR